jgi:hypothetical protein
MAIPGFSAEASLGKKSGRYRQAHSDRADVGVAPARMTPQECYRRDSNCTQFCGRVQDSEWRHECFMLCNKYLDNCLGRGIWTDQAALSRA